MKKHFYSHLVEIESLILEINKLPIEVHERAHLIALVDSNLHHTVLDAVLSELSEEEKKKFLEHVASEDHDKVWKHLNEKVDNIEEKIKNAAQSLKKELHKDIEESK